MLADAGAPLRSWPRGKVAADVIVLHESVTGSRDKTVGVLGARGLSVHFIVDRDGSVTQHAPLERQCAHAGGVYNARSVAIEIVNRYYGSQADDGDPDINTVWAHKGWYVLPTASQCEAVWQTVVAVHEAVATIPLVFPATPDLAKGFSWGRFPWLSRLVRQRQPGVVAHHRVDHADGLFAEHYCQLRALDVGPVEAFGRTVAAARSMERVTPLVVGPA